MIAESKACRIGELCAIRVEMWVHSAISLPTEAYCHLMIAGENNPSGGT